MLQKQMKWPFFLQDSSEPEKEEGDINSVDMMKYVKENSEIPRASKFSILNVISWWKKQLWELDYSDRCWKLDAREPRFWWFLILEHEHS